jgi:hypothetical protein
MRKMLKVLGGLSGGPRGAMKKLRRAKGMLRSRGL